MEVQIQAGSFHDCRRLKVFQILFLKKFEKKNSFPTEDLFALTQCPN